MTKLLYFAGTWLSTSHPFNHLIFATTHKAVIIIFILYKRKKNEVQSWEVVKLGLEPGLSDHTAGGKRLGLGWSTGPVCVMLSFWVQTGACKHTILCIMRVPMFVYMCACDHGFCHSIPVLLKKLCLYFSLFIHYGWQPTPVLLPGESRGWRSLVGYSPRVTKSRTWMSDFTFTLLSYSISS